MTIVPSLKSVISCILHSVLKKIILFYFPFFLLAKRPCLLPSTLWPNKNIYFLLSMAYL